LTIIASYFIDNKLHLEVSTKHEIATSCTHAMYARSGYVTTQPSRATKALIVN